LPGLTDGSRLLPVLNIRQYPQRRVMCMYGVSQAGCLLTGRFPVGLISKEQVADSQGQVDCREQGSDKRPWNTSMANTRNPTLLRLPFIPVHMQAGIEALTFMDKDNLIWEMVSWGRVSFFPCLCT